MKTLYIWMPLRMVLLIAIYALASQLLYVYMIKPFNDQKMKGAESDMAVRLMSKCVILLNVVIQTVVMVDVAGAKIRRLAKVDQITFGWNTLLLVVTLGYFILLEAYRE